MLACSFSKPYLYKALDVGRKKLDRWVKLLVDAAWVKVDRKTIFN